MAELTVGYAAMLEQFDPREVVDLTALAEAARVLRLHGGRPLPAVGARTGEASFVWSVLAAVGERTTGDLGPGVTCPSFRFHPAIVAQASATTEAMYPGRHWLGLGSGEALNEHVVGGYWPEVGERSARLFEAVELIKRLFDASIAGKDIKHRGQYFTMETSRLWTMPPVAPPVLVATAGPINAKRTGKLADGIITVGAPLEKIDGLFAKFAEGAREAGKDPDTMPKVLQLHMSWAETDEQALANAVDQWPNGGMKFPKADIRSPHDFAQMAKLVRPEDFEGRLLISADPDEHRAYIQRYVDLGFRPGLPAQRRAQPGASGSRSSAATCCPSSCGDGAAPYAAGPLAGVRVLELPSIGPAPFAAMLLADLGADVVRVDRPGGQQLQVVRARAGPAGSRQALVGARPQVDRSTCDTLLALVEQADLLIEGFRPGVAERLGIGPEPCLARNPRLVYGRMTGWGQDGPSAATAGHDITYIAVTGALHAIGEAGGAPQIPLNLVGDFAGALYLVTGLLAALHESRASGHGQVVDAAMVDSSAHLMTAFYGLTRAVRGATSAASTCSTAVRRSTASIARRTTAIWPSAPRAGVLRRAARPARARAR